MHSSSALCLIKSSWSLGSAKIFSLTKLIDLCLCVRLSASLYNKISIVDSPIPNLQFLIYLLILLYSVYVLVSNRVHNGIDNQAHKGHKYISNWGHKRHKWSLCTKLHFLIDKKKLFYSDCTYTLCVPSYRRTYALRPPLISKVFQYSVLLTVHPSYTTDWVNVLWAALLHQNYVSI